MTGRIAKTPVVMQMEALECGAACLDMILAYYDKWVPLERVRLDCGVSRDGSNARNIMRAARSYGLEARGFRAEVAGLRTKVSFPCITHWNFSHFVMLCGFRGKYAYIIRALPMGIHTFISEGQGGFSGGQKQRLMIARAIAPKPKILLFDEATSALDNKTQKQISQALDGLNCTRIVIAHRLSTIRNCDRILVLDRGKIIEEGTYESLIAKGGFFAELVERQRLD